MYSSIILLPTVVRFSPVLTQWSGSSQDRFVLTLAANASRMSRISNILLRHNFVFIPFSSSEYSKLNTLTIVFQYSYQEFVVWNILKPRWIYIQIILTFLVCNRKENARFHLKILFLKYREFWGIALLLNRKLFKKINLKKPYILYL